MYSRQLEWKKQHHVFSCTLAIANNIGTIKIIIQDLPTSCAPSWSCGANFLYRPGWPWLLGMVFSSWLLSLGSALGCCTVICAVAVGPKGLHDGSAGGSAQKWVTNINHSCQLIYCMHIYIYISIYLHYSDTEN